MAATNSAKQKPVQKGRASAREAKSTARYAVMQDGEKMQIEREDGKYYYFAHTKMRKMNPMITHITEERGKKVSENGSV